MLHSYAAELFKFRKRPAVWVVFAVWLTLMLVFTYLFPYLSYRSAANPQAAQRLLAGLLPSHLPGQAITGYPIWGGALIVILGALCLGSEYSWGTMKTMLSNRPGRLMFYGAQVAALLTAVAALDDSASEQPPTQRRDADPAASAQSRIRGLYLNRLAAGETPTQGLAHPSRTGIL